MKTKILKLTVRDTCDIDSVIRIFNEERKDEQITLEAIPTFIAKAIAEHEEKFKKEINDRFRIENPVGNYYEGYNKAIEDVIAFRELPKPYQEGGEG